MRTARPPGAGVDRLEMRYHAIGRCSQVGPNGLFRTSGRIVATRNRFGPFSASDFSQGKANRPHDPHDPTIRNRFGPFSDPSATAKGSHTRRRAPTIPRATYD